MKRLPDGFPPALGTLHRHAVDRDWEAAHEVLVAEGFLSPSDPLSEDALRVLLEPLATPSASGTFRFTRSWLRAQAARTASLGAGSPLRHLNLPPSYVLVNRVVGSATAVLSQLECDIPFRGEAERWLPGFSA